MQGLLGDARSFKTTYAKRIETGNDKSATSREREVIARCSLVLAVTYIQYDHNRNGLFTAGWCRYGIAAALYHCTILPAPDKGGCAAGAG